jgi:hypothetical protein
LTKIIAQVQIGAHPKYDSTPMRSSTHQWNLSRFFGSQPVGCASSTSWPEAGIATRIIPAQSSRRVFRQPSNADLTTWHLATCRPADLPTWRLGDLANLIIGDTGPRILLRPQLSRFVHIQHRGRGIRRKPTLQSTPSLPKPEQLSKQLLWCHRSASSSNSQPFPIKIARKQSFKKFQESQTYI